MNNPDISVVIPTLGRTAVVRDCLESLLRQEFSNFQIIIVSDSVNEIRRLAEEYRALRISCVQQAGKGLVTARNSGLLHAQGSIVSFIDDDVVLDKSWTKEILHSFASSAQVGGVSGPTIIPQELINNRDILAFHNKIKGGLSRRSKTAALPAKRDPVGQKILVRDRPLMEPRRFGRDRSVGISPRRGEEVGSLGLQPEGSPFWKLLGKLYAYFVLENQPSGVGRIFKSGAFSLGANYAESSKLTGEIEVDYLEACNMSFRRDILDKIGGFSGEYKGIGDWSEPDLAFRVKEAGFRLIFNPRAIVYHHISQKGVFQQRGADSYQRMRNFIYFYFKWIKPNTPEKCIRFAFNLLFLNLYWCYKFLQTGRVEWLSGIRGIFKF
jgi:GT2 family glycosyltransferase